MKEKLAFIIFLTFHIKPNKIQNKRLGEIYGKSLGAVADGVHQEGQ
jgi:hypothetical protein